MTNPTETTTEAVTAVDQLEVGSEVSVSGESFLPESNLTVDKIGVDYGDYDGTVVEASLDRANARSYSFLVTDDGFVKTTNTNGVFTKGVGMYVVTEVEPDTTVDGNADDYAVDVGDVARGDTVRVTYMSTRNGSKKTKVGVVTSVVYDYYNGRVDHFSFDTGKEKNGDPITHRANNGLTSLSLYSHGPRQTSKLGPVAEVEVYHGDDRDFDVRDDLRDDAADVFFDLRDDEDDTLDDAADVARDTADSNTLECYDCGDEVTTDDVVTDHESRTEEEVVDAGRVHPQTGERMNVKTRDVRKAHRVPKCPDCGGERDARTDGGHDADDSPEPGEPFRIDFRAYSGGNPAVQPYYHVPAEVFVHHFEDTDEHVILTTQGWLDDHEDADGAESAEWARAIISTARPSTPTTCSRTTVSTARPRPTAATGAQR